MRVQIYMGGFRYIRKSGIGRAILHQTRSLEAAGIETTNSWWKPADIIHINTIFPDSVIASCIAKMQGKSVVYYAHSTEEDFRNSFKGSNWLAPFFKRWIQFCYNLGDIIITPTEYSKSLLRKYGIDKQIYPISNGIDTYFFLPNDKKKQSFRQKYGIAEGTPVIISAGHFIARKGIIEFADLARRMPNAEFMWFGNTNLSIVPQAVRDVVENPPKNLHFPGFVTPNELRDAYCGADVFAFMTHEETEGIVVLEALACGISVVVRDIPVYDHWLEADVHVCKAKTTEEFKEKIESILCGEKLQLRENGLEIARQRSMKEIGLKLKAIYEKEGFVK